MPASSLREPTDARPVARGGGQPVLLVTFLDRPFHPAATALAVATALEGGLLLVVADIVELPPLPMSVNLGHDHIGHSPDVEAALRTPVDLARAHGIRVERLLVKSPRLVSALVQLVTERRPGLVVVGTDPAALGRRLRRRVRTALRSRTGCLIWWAGDDPVPPDARDPR